MNPLLIGAIVLAAIVLLPKLASAQGPLGSGATGTPIESIEALAARYQDKPATTVPPDVMNRFAAKWNQVLDSGQAGWVMSGVLPSEPPYSDPKWNYIIGKMPGRAVWTPNTWGPTAVMKRIEVKPKQTGFGGTFGSILGGLGGGIFGGPGGAAAGAKLGGGLGGMF